MRVQHAAGFHPRSTLSEPRREYKQILECQKSKVLFNYSGKYTSIRLPKNEATLCRNFFKGLLNLLIVTPPRNHREYEVLEDGLEGECNTRYVLYEEKKNSNIYLFNKFRDLNNCKQKIMLTVGIPYLQLFQQPNCFQREKFVQGASALLIKVKRDSKGDLITEVKSEQVLDFPLGGVDATGYMKAE
ncbi:vitellogenin-2-like [Pantherophis guttatus]|uniref:Vitellogenin-2-like n=1 Tax=Pantherophis guttatus TaxID=94885 RepID=A0A6P9DDR9_PANGU|nr:vitellogenin-2-like [Pantherophis guttatus]